MSGVSVLSGGGFDTSKYMNYEITNSFTIPDINSHTIININGKGYLQKWVIYNTSTSNLFSRITIDGNVVFYAYSKSQANGCLSTFDSLVCNNGTLYLPIFYLSGSYVYTQINGNGKFPYIDGGNCNSIIPKNLYFKRSLKIEIISPTTGYTVWYNFKGGVM
jgi:hypothetical protein